MQLPTTKPLVHNEQEIQLVSETGRTRGGSKPVDYYALRFFRLDNDGTEIPFDREIKDAQGHVLDKAGDIWLTNAIDLIGKETALDWLQTRANQGLKAAQLKEGEDVLTPADKYEKARAYIQGGFGATRQSATAALQAQLAAQSAKAARMSTLLKEFMTCVDPAKKAALLAELATLA